MSWYKNATGIGVYDANGKEVERERKKKERGHMKK